jgi:catechol 2,3-dioxygenase-like lactoylglutathione lyase family enzyme
LPKDGLSPTIRPRSAAIAGEDKMNFSISRLGHVGIHCSDVERSIEFYRKVVGLKVTGNWRPPEAFRSICFMRVSEKHHDLVLFELPKGVDRNGLDTSDSADRQNIGVQHIAFEFDSREDWLHAIDHVRSCGVEIVAGPLVHGLEAVNEQSFPGGSGSHAFYFLDPDGNRIEFYCWMMRISKPSLAAPTPDL